MQLVIYRIKKSLRCQGEYILFIFIIFFILDNMVEMGSQSRVGTRSIGVGTSGRFCYEDDSDSYLDYKELKKNVIHLNRSGFPTS